MIGHSNVEGKLRKHLAIPPDLDCSGGTRYLAGVPKMRPTHCFLLTLEAIKLPSQKINPQIIVIIFRHCCLCLL